MEQIAVQPQTTKRRDIYQEVTDTIIEQLEAGTAPWHQPWNGSNHPFRIPVNGKTNKAYQGVNILLLWSAAKKQQFTTHEWATFKDWNAKKETIRAGEKKGGIVVWFEMLEKEVDGETKKIPCMKYSPVFNRCQLNSYNPDNVIQPDVKPVVERLEIVEKFIGNTGAIVKHIGDDASFISAKDEIHMPPINSFIDTQFGTATENFYGTLCHELIHWTGLEKRLDRKFGKRFGDNAYAEEELVAELGAAFLCAELEITNAPKPDHASYLAHWLEVLKQNKHAIITAASFASKAVDYLHWLQPNP